MTEFELQHLTDANWPIKNCPSGLEARMLLTGWAEQLKQLAQNPNTNCGEINNCLVRLTQIAKEVTINSRPEKETST